MIVHLGVVVVAIALAAASSYGQRTQLVLKPGQSLGFDGHVFTYVGWKQFSVPNKSGETATVLVDGAPFYPAISVFPGSEGIGTPAVDSSVREDTYLTLADINASPDGPATIDVVIQPMVLWLWVGGALTAFGAVLAAAPSRRRRSKDKSGTTGPVGRAEAAGGPDPAAPAAQEPAPARVGAGSAS
jgi:cytochrome c-type biogenesis protein CcmF